MQPPLVDFSNYDDSTSKLLDTESRISILELNLSQMNNSFKLPSKNYSNKLQNEKPSK
jgi:hypothetical protein